MVTTITLNPAIDTTWTMDRFDLSNINRIKESTQDAGGKGINISRILHTLGVDTVCAGFTAGSNGTKLERLLDGEGVPYDFTHVSGQTRENVTISVREGSKTIKINDKGSAVTPEDMARLLETVKKHAMKSQVIALSGSFPPGVSEADVIKLMEEVRSPGVQIVCDSESLSLPALLRLRPAIIKPNKPELEKLIGKEIADQDDLVAAGLRMVEQGFGKIIVSLGESGLVGFDGARVYQVSVPKIAVRSTVGAGDAVVAGYLYAAGRGSGFADSLRQGAALGTAMAASLGTRTPDLRWYDDVLSKVQVQQIA